MEKFLFLWFATLEFLLYNGTYLLHKRPGERKCRVGFRSTVALFKGGTVEMTPVPHKKKLSLPSPRKLHSAWLKG